jgi:hypothetical protein
MILWHYPEEGGDIKQIIVGSMNIDTLSVKSKLKTKTFGSGTLVK